MTNSNSQSPTSSLAPRVETLFEAPIRHDESVIKIDLVMPPSGRPPSLRLARTTREGRTYSVVISPMFRHDALDAVRRWIELVDAHEARGGPIARRVVVGSQLAAIGPQRATSRNGGGR
jgi:hypothetical protein